MMIFIYFRATSREHTWQDNVKAEETSLNYDYKHRKWVHLVIKLSSNQHRLAWTIRQSQDWLSLSLDWYWFKSAEELRFILYYKTNTWCGKSTVLRDKSCIIGQVTRPVLGGALMVTICIVFRLFQSLTHCLKYHIYLKYSLSSWQWC